LRRRLCVAWQANGVKVIVNQRVASVNSSRELTLAHRDDDRRVRPEQRLKSRPGDVEVYLMSDMHSARKAVSNPAAPSQANAWSVPPVAHRDAEPISVARKSSNPFASMSGERAKVEAVSWDELATVRDLEGETKNFKVPRELMEMARANRVARRRAPVRTPLVPKPTLEMAIVVPRAAMPSGLPPRFAASELAVIPVGAIIADESGLASEVPLAPEAPLALEAPLVALEAPLVALEGPPGVEVHLVAAALESSVEPEAPFVLEARVRPEAAAPVREPARRPATERLMDETGLESVAPSRLRGYTPFLTGSVIVGTYVALCYLANALLATLP
jgi:hypothetical protein